MADFKMQAVSPAADQKPTGYTPLQLSWGTLARLSVLAVGTTAIWVISESAEFETIHSLVRSIGLAFLLLAALTVATSIANLLLTVMDALDKLALGTLLVGSLSFAQPSDPAAQQRAKSDDGEKAPVRRTVNLSLYSGISRHSPSDLFLKQPGGTDMVLKKVQWKSKSTQTEPYWGARATYWSRRMAAVGVMFDYTHDKAFLWKRQEVKQSGMRDGKPVPPLESVTKTFTQLKFSHGLNFATLNAVFRLQGLRPRITPYVGVGIGLSVPHVYMQREGQTKKTRTYKHMIAGPTFQVLGGVDWRIFASDKFSWFTEYKLNHSRNDAALKGGGSLKTKLWSRQVIPLGFTFRAPLPGRIR